jgi:hypothetical protein
MIILERQSINALAAASGSRHDETGGLSTVDLDLVDAYALQTSGSASAFSSSNLLVPLLLPGRLFA